MQMKAIKDSDKYQWTEHSKFKMQYYGLSPQRVLRVIRAPYRIETGIVENTIAVMQPGGNIKKGPAKSGWGRSSFGNSAEKEVSPDGKSWSSEIWVMYQLRGAQKSEVESLKSKRNKNLPTDRQNSIRQLADKILNSANRKIRIISAWRYPGVTDENDPIPEDILREIAEII